MHPIADPPASSSPSTSSNHSTTRTTTLLHFAEHSTSALEAHYSQNLHPRLNDIYPSRSQDQSSFPVSRLTIPSTLTYPSSNVENVITSMSNMEVMNQSAIVKPALRTKSSTNKPTPASKTALTSSTTHPQTTQRESSRLLTEEIKGTVREEVEKIANGLIKEELEKEIEGKIGSKKISTSRRSRVYKKVSSEVRKQIQETIDKIVEEQLNTTSSDDQPDDRVSDEIAAKLVEAVRSLLNRNMEKAIADEIIEQVKVEKLTRTPTIVPEFHVPSAFGVRHTQTFMVLLFLAISYVQRVDFYVAEVAMIDANKANPYFEEFDWDETVLSLLLSSFYWGYFVLQIPGGILAERYGPKLVMSASMMACSLVGLLMPVGTLIGDWIALYVLKLLQGVFQGTFIPAVYVFTSRWIPPKEKSRLFTPACGGMQLGVVVGMPVSGILCASFLGWPSAFFFSSCIGFIWVVVWVIVAANSPSVHRSISREEKLYIEGSFGFGEITLRGAEKIIPWRSILKSTPFWALVVCHFGQNWAFSTLITEMPAYINNVLNLNITDNAFFSAMTYFVGWVFIVVFGFVGSAIQEKNWFSLTFQRKAWNSVSALGGTVCFLILGISRTKSQLLAITLLTVTVTTNSAAYNGVFSNHADLSPNYIGVLMGLSNMIANVASVMAPMYVGYIVRDSTNADQWSVVFLTSAVVLFGSNVIFVLFGTSEIQPWNTPSDLHLQLEKVDAAALSFRRQKKKSQTYVVASTYYSGVLDQDNEIYSPKQGGITHRNSI